MKHNLLTAAIVAATSFGSINAMAFDSQTIVTGSSDTDFHFLRVDFAYADNGSTSVDGEGARTLSVASTSTGPEVFTKNTGDPDTGEVVSEWVRQWLPNLFGGMTITVGSGDESTNYAFNTAANGKITDGWFASEAASVTTPSDSVFNYVDFDNRRVVTLNGCNAIAPGIAEARRVMAEGGDGTTLSPALPTNCVVSQHGEMSYETCDTTQECGQFSKSVPVPAFATATLALGLAGITVLTSRRRAIK